MLRSSRQASASLIAVLFVVPTRPAFGQGRTTVAFRDVNLMPMTCQCILPHQVVVVSGGTIGRVGPLGQVAIPSGARIIEGRGKTWLLPGLADMHVHTADAEELPLYLANGVTTILNLGDGAGHPSGQLRDLVRAGRVDGPTIFAALFLDGPGGGGLIVKTDSAARAAVRWGKERGYQFVKVYNSLSAPVYRAILAEAATLGLGVTGHGVRSIPLPEALAGGQSLVVHGEEYLYTVLRNTTRADEIEAAAGMTRQAGGSLIPNLSAYEVIARQWGSPSVVDTLMALPYVKYLSPKNQDEWRRSDYVRRSGNLDGKLRILRRLTRAMQDSGVRLLTGTDSPGIPGMAPGFALHEDLRTLIEAGITPWQALTAATRSPGEYVGRFLSGEPAFGVITEGSRADLILVGGNPIESFATLRNPLGVMARGRWYPEAALRRTLDSLARLSAAERTAMIAAGKRARAVGGAVLAAELGARPFRFEYALNSLGYALIDEKRAADAVPLFELNTRAFPTSSNVWESLCEGYQAIADTARAKLSCQKALELDPWNQDAQGVLARLAGAPPPH